MQWTLEQEPPPGSDSKFKTGALKGRTYLDTTLEHPEQFYIMMKQSDSSRSAETKDYVEWVRRYFTLNTATKTIHLKAADDKSKGSKCEHLRTTKKGSSARFIRTTCMDCGEVWQEERDVPTMDPKVCRHARTDHRGSNKQVRRTYCLDCGTYIEEVSQLIAKTQKDDSTITAAERDLLDRFNIDEYISKQGIMQAAELMYHEAQQLADRSSLTLADAGKLFLDYCDRVTQSSNGAGDSPTATTHRMGDDVDTEEVELLDGESYENVRAFVVTLSLIHI